MSLPALSAPCGASLLRMRTFSRVCSIGKFVAEGAFIPEFVFGTVVLFWLRFWIYRSYSVLLVSPSLSFRPTAFCLLSSWSWSRIAFGARFTDELFHKEGDPKQKYLAKSLYLLLCLSWLCWCWRHAACIPPGTDSACSGHPFPIVLPFRCRRETHPLRDGVAQPGGLRATWREHLQC